MDIKQALGTVVNNGVELIQLELSDFIITLSDMMFKNMKFLQDQTKGYTFSTALQRYQLKSLLLCHTCQ